MTLAVYIMSDSEAPEYNVAGVAIGLILLAVFDSLLGMTPYFEVNFELMIIQFGWPLRSTWAFVVKRQKTSKSWISKFP